MIPIHRCIRGMCDPDEGIHCVPFLANYDLEAEPEPMNSMLISDHGFEVIKFRRDPDVTPQLMESIRAEFGITKKCDPKHKKGFLAWVRKKAPA